MIDRPWRAHALSFLLLLAAGCSPTPELPQEPASMPATPTQVDESAAPGAPDTTPPAPTEAVPAGPVGAEPAGPPPPVVTEDRPSSVEPAAPVEEPSPRPAPPASSQPSPAPPAPAGAGTGSSDATGVVDPGGAVEVAATKPGLTRIGVAKCQLCHKVQHASWSETAHAKRTPPLDCESCHGPGSEYKGLTVMKDPEKARAAGLVDPTEVFCSKCHKSGWSEDMLRRAHAHEDEES